MKNGKGNELIHIKETIEDKLFDIFNIIFLSVFLLAVLYPIVIVVSSSLSHPESLTAGKVWLFPVRPTLDGYRIMLSHKQIWIGLGNSVFYTVVGTAVNMVISVLAAYPLSRKDFLPRNTVSLMFAFTMWFSGGLIPTYLLIRSLGMYNTRWVMIIPKAMSVWNVIIIRTYFQSGISHELFECSRLDGCDDFTYLLKIALPLARPVLAVICLYYAVGHWNEFVHAYIYLQKQSLQPAQVVLREVLMLSRMQEISVDAMSEGNKAQLMSELLKYSLVIVASLPMIVIYPFVQKHFVKGIMLGAVKG